MSLKISSEQKALESRRNKLQAEHRVLKQEITDNQRKAGEMKRAIDAFQKQIEDLKNKAPKELIVSEHAMLRYISRVMGVDLSKIEDKILTQEVLKASSTLGNCKVNIEDGFKVVIRDKIVVTVD